MKTQRITFPNKQGHQLSARLELPVDTRPHNFAIFAHCFTCSKNLLAVGNISRALTQEGIGVLRFDFTGLGESQGEFGDTTFATNIQDLVAVSEYLETNYKAPTLLVGHSLGGAAVLRAKKHLPNVQAVATVGAPYDPEHVSHLLKGDLSEIRQKGRGKVNIMGREFEISRAFLEELEQDEPHQIISSLKAALLVLHSPTDQFVEIDNATKIFKAAQHPRSFISLDNADHLLTQKADSLYVGAVIANWAMRYLHIPKDTPIKTASQVAVRTTDGLTSDVLVGQHHFTADEPTDLGGNDFGPTPYGLLTAALGSCTAMTLRLYADRKGWDLREVMVHLNHNKTHKKDCESCESEGKAKIDVFEREIALEGNLDEKQQARLLEIANKCPVHRTLEGKIEIETKLKKG